LSIARETFFTRLAGALSFHDIQFEDERFNAEFHVSANDRKFANDLIDARMMQWLLANAGDRSIEVVGNRVLVAGPKVAPTEMIEVIGIAKGFLDHIPKVAASLYPPSGPARRARREAPPR